jgi:hypothetical protein
MMNGIYGPSFGMPLARWDRDSQSWRTSVDTSLWDLPMSSLTLPTWGCLRDGVLYELPTPEPATVEHDYLSLPTPVADNSRGLPNGGNFQSLPNAALGLPTPKASDGERGRDLPRIRQDESGRELATAVGLLPTPVVNDMGSGKTMEWWEEWTEKIGGHGKSLEQEALRIGDNIHRQLKDGNQSLDALPQSLLFGEMSGTD